MQREAEIKQIKGIQVDSDPDPDPQYCSKLRRRGWNEPVVEVTIDIFSKTFVVRPYLVNRFCRLAPIYWLVNAVLLATENQYFDDQIFGKYCGEKNLLRLEV